MNKNELKKVESLKLYTTFQFIDFETFGVCTLLYKAKGVVGFKKENGDIAASISQRLVFQIGYNPNQKQADVTLATEYAKSLSKRISNTFKKGGITQKIVWWI